MLWLTILLAQGCLSMCEAAVAATATTAAGAAAAAVAAAAAAAAAAARAPYIRNRQGKSNSKALGPFGIPANAVHAAMTQGAPCRCPKTAVHWLPGDGARPPDAPPRFRHCRPANRARACMDGCGGGRRLCQQPAAPSGQPLKYPAMYLCTTRGLNVVKQLCVRPGSPAFSPGVS